MAIMFIENVREDLPDPVHLDGSLHVPNDIG